LCELISTLIFTQAVLGIGLELEHVKEALRRKIQQTGQPFPTTEALVEAVLQVGVEFESVDIESNVDEHNDDENRNPNPEQSTSAAPNQDASGNSGMGSAGSDVLEEDPPAASHSETQGTLHLIRNLEAFRIAIGKKI